MSYTPAVPDSVPRYIPLTSEFIPAIVDSLINYHSLQRDKLYIHMRTPDDKSIVLYMTEPDLFILHMGERRSKFNRAELENELVNYQMTSYSAL